MPVLFFDLDDTIISHDAPVVPAWENTYEHFKKNLGNTEKEVLMETLVECSRIFWTDPEKHKRGRLNLAETRREIVRNTFKKLNIAAEDIADSYADFFTELRENMITPFPGAIETLEYFRERNLPMALITNGAADIQNRKISRFNLRPYFKEIVIEGEFGIGKPHPEGFLHALKTLNARPEDTWMIGDSLEFDIAGAKPLGIKTVWNNWSRTVLPDKPPAVPDLEIHSISELVNLV